MKIVPIYYLLKSGFDSKKETFIRCGTIEILPSTQNNWNQDSLDHTACYQLSKIQVVTTKAQVLFSLMLWC